MRREYPTAPIVGVGAVIVRNAQALLIQRGNEPNRGRWCIPGGVLELGVTLAEAAVREVREECGLEIEPQGVLSTFDMIHRDELGRVRYHYVLIDMGARYVGGEATAGTDALGVRWAGAAELDSLDIVPRLVPVLRQVLHSSEAGQPTRP